MRATVSRIAIIAVTASPLVFTSAGATDFVSPASSPANSDQGQQLLQQIAAERERQQQENENTAAQIRELLDAGSGDPAGSMREQLQDDGERDAQTLQSVIERANSAGDERRPPVPDDIPADSDRRQQMLDARERLEAEREQREQEALRRQEELEEKRQDLLDRLQTERDRQQQENENAAAEARERAAAAVGDRAERMREQAQDRQNLDDGSVNSLANRIDDAPDQREPDRGSAPGDSDQMQQMRDAREQLEAERQQREQEARSRREELEGNREQLLDRLQAERERQRQENEKAAAEARERAEAALRGQLQAGRFDVNAKPSPEVLRDLVRNAPLEPVTVASLAGFVRETPAAPAAPADRDANTAESTEEENSERNRAQLVAQVVRENPPPAEPPTEPEEEEPLPPEGPDEPTQPGPEPEPVPDPGFPYHDAWMLGDYDAPDAPPLESLAGTATASFEGNVYGTFYGASNEDISGTISLNVDFGMSAIDGTMTFDNDRGQLAVEASWAPGENHVGGSLSGAAFGGEIRDGHLNGMFLGPNGEELAGHWGGVIVDGLGHDLGGIEAGFMSRQ